MPDPTGTLSPADQLADMISRTPNTASALATGDRLHREAGLTQPHLQPERMRPEPARPEPIGPALDAPPDLSSTNASGRRNCVSIACSSAFGDARSAGEPPCEGPSVPYSCPNRARTG